MAYPPEKSVVEPPQFATLSDYRWQQQQIERTERKVRMILDMLIAKKIITEAEAKIFQETNSEEIVKWFMERNKTKK
jgi:hypothetical protein